MNDYSHVPAEFAAEADIAFMRHGNAIDIRLTRPKALNAFTHNMAKALYAGLRIWAKDETASHVVISADTGEKRAFCAGGDIRDLYEGFQAGAPRHAFFRDEYRLNDAIAAFPKPYIALMDGVVMGGGAGISMHGSHRIVTENTRFAMPEVGIGLIPDVGGSYILPRIKNRYGVFLGLSGTLIGPEECLEAGIGTHYCSAADIEKLRVDLLKSAKPINLLKSLREKPIPNLLRTHKLDIKVVFSATTLDAIFERLEAKSESNPLLLGAFKRMKAASPLSFCLAFEQMKRGKKLSLRDGLIMEYRLVSRILHGPDLYEGIRSTIIDRSIPRQWQHASIAEVDPKLIAFYFTPPPEGDLTFEA